MADLQAPAAPEPGVAELAYVFLSYSRADKDSVLRVQAQLKDAGLQTFLDRDELVAGQGWLPALEQGIARSAAVAVFLGPTGLGTWQQREIQLALDWQAEKERQGRQFPVIPILLARDTDPPGGFLRLNTWVDLRADPDDPAQLHFLVAGIRGRAPAGADTLREAICPYRGLLAFREEDEGLFFGRDAATAELLAKVRGEPLVTLVGRSGSGKSSVVQAGLIPALRRRADGRVWAIHTLRPGPEPLHALVRTFDPPPPDLPPFEAAARVRCQVDLLRKDDGLLGEHIRTLLADQREKGTDRLLLYVDQWEELYTQARHHPTPDPKQAAADVDRFIGLLLDATRTSPCTVVLSARADFYGDLLKQPPLVQTVVNLGPMEPADLEAAIRKPAEAVRLTVDQPLVDELLDEVTGDLGKLPLLEYALKETWQHREPGRLTLNAYGKAGGIDGAIARRANDIYERLSETQQAAARRLFVSLVTPGEGREDTRARVTYPESEEAIRAAVEAFSHAGARLLVTGDDAAASARTVEISHEALIREWDKLKDWIKANREALRRREHVRARMQQWEDSQKDPTQLLPPGLPLEEGRKLRDEPGDVLVGGVLPYIEASIASDRRRLRRRNLLAFTVFLLLAGGAGIATWQWLQAREHARIAASERDRAERNLRVAAQTADNLVFDLARNLTDVSGVSRDTIRRILSHADNLLTELAGGEDAPPELLRTRAAALDRFVQTYMAQGDLGAALASAEQAREIVAQLAAAQPENPGRRRDLSVSWNKLGAVRQAQGDLAGALAAYEAGRAIAERLAASDPGNAGWQRDLSVSWNRLGEVRQSQGDLAGALAAYEASHAIAERLAASDPGNAEWQRDLSVSWNKLGDVRQAQGDLAGALAAYEASRAIRERLASSDPGNAGWQRDLSVSWNKLGDVRQAQGDLAGALAAYEATHTIRERLAASDPGNAGWQRDLSVSWERLGEVRQAQGDLAGALAAYEASRAIRERLAASDPGNAGWQRDLSVSWNKLGDVRRAQGDLAGALAAYEARHAIAERLAASDPGNAGWQRDLSVSWNKLGDVRQAQGDLAGALAAYEAVLAIRERLAASDPGNAEWQRDLIVSHWRIAAVLEELPERRGEAATRWGKALAVARELVGSGRLAPPDAWIVEELERRLAAVEGGGGRP